MKQIKARLMQIESEHQTSFESISNLKMTIPNPRYTILALGSDANWTSTTLSTLIFPELQ